MRRFLMWSVSGALIVGLSGCAFTRDLFGRDAKPDRAEVVAAGSGPSTGDHEARLRSAVESMIASTNTTPQFIRNKPYFYKEYEVYPAESSNYTVDLTEKDSRTVPYIADVRLPKVRYATKMHRNRGEARDDTNFFRETGTEVRTYELRYGDWFFVGSMFQVDTKEEQINGEWVPAQEEVVKAVADEPSQGWLGRTWSWVTGR